MKARIGACTHQQVPEEGAGKLTGDVGRAHTKVGEAGFRRLGCLFKPFVKLIYIVSRSVYFFNILKK